MRKVLADFRPREAPAKLGQASKIGLDRGPLRTRQSLASSPAAVLRSLYECLVFYGLLGFFGLCSLCWSVVAAILYPLLPRRVGEPLGQRAIMIGFRGFVAVMRMTGIIEFDLAELDALKRGPAMVIAPNHPSMLDAVLVISRLPHVVCAAKAEIWDNVFLGGGARLAGYIRNDSPAKLIRAAARQLSAGRDFLIFPEGTRSSACPVGAFKGGFALIAKRARVSIQTVFIESNSGFLGRGWPLFKKPAFPLVYRARLGCRVEVESDVQELVTRLHRYYREELAPGDH